MKDTDKVTLTVAQLKRLILEGSKEIETIYDISSECEHEGDLDRICREITRGGFAEIVSINVPDETWSIDQYVKIYFRVLDEQRFQEETDWDLSEISSSKTSLYIGKKCAW